MQPVLSNCIRDLYTFTAISPTRKLRSWLRGLVSIHLQRDEHLSRREANRRNYSIGDQVADKARHSLGNGLRGSRLRHPTFQRIFGRAENARGGWTFAETPLNAISRSQLEPRVSRSEAAVQSAS
jgi:hypothetical protein